MSFPKVDTKAARPLSEYLNILRKNLAENHGRYLSLLESAEPDGRKIFPEAGS